MCRAPVEGFAPQIAPQAFRGRGGDGWGLRECNPGGQPLPGSIWCKKGKFRDGINWKSLVCESQISLSGRFVSRLFCSSWVVGEAGEREGEGKFSAEGER